MKIQMSNALGHISKERIEWFVSDGILEHLILMIQVFGLVVLKKGSQNQGRKMWVVVNTSRNHLFRYLRSFS